MSIRSLTLLALLAPAAVAAVACSSAPAPTIKQDPASTDKDPDTGSSSADITSKPAPTPAVTPPPAAAPYDAGTVDAGVDASRTPVQPPGPTTQFCAQLSRCCGNLSTFQALACTGTAIAGDETACGVELAVCNAGGIDLGGIFGDDDDNAG